MCEQCLVNPFYYGEFAPGWFLIRATRESDMKIGQWGLLECNDPSIVFTTTPQLYTNREIFDTAIDNFSDEMFIDIATGHRLFEAVSKVKISWKVKKLFIKLNVRNFNDRFFVYLADFIERSNPIKESDPFKHLDNTLNHDYSFNPKLPYLEK